MTKESQKAAITLICAACLALSLRAGNDYYVDANNGDDAWDGSTAVIPTEEQKLLDPVPGPRRTLAGAMAISGLTSGDTVHAAPGVYNEGGMSSSYGSNRVVVAAGVLLVGDQGAAVTTIEGKISTAEDNSEGCAADSMRAVRLAGGAAIKGFTITKGRPTKVSNNDGNGGGVCCGDPTPGLAVDCVFSNNLASYRGNAAGSNVILLRCDVDSGPAGPNSARVFSCYSAVQLIDCVHRTSHTCYSGCSAYNTTFVNGYVYQYATARNCLFLSGHGSSPVTLYNCISASAKSANTTDGDDKNQYSVAKADIGYEAGTYRPLAGSYAVDAGNDSYYALATNGWTGTQAWWQTFIGKDYAGGARRLGAAIDVGAGESDPSVRALTITDAQTALVVTGAAKGNTILYAGETNTFTLARNYSTAKLLTGVRVNGEFFSFTGEDADRTYEYTYGYGDPIANFVVEAVYAEHNDWYVNPNTDPALGPVGDDANNGYTKYAPKRTLAGVMSNSLVAGGDVVHAAPGVYNEGTMAASASSTVTNRVIVKANVGLVADEGRDVTAIEGFIPEKEKWGTTDPIRCVEMNSDAYLKGFTIRKGMASMGQGTGTIYGNSGGGVEGGTAIDCVISNCYAVRGGAAYRATLIRCLTTGNSLLPDGTTNPAGGKASSIAAGLYYCNSVYNSKIVGASIAPGTCVNSWFVSSLTHNTGSFGSKVPVYNCYVEDDRGYLYLTNSIVKGAVNANSALGEGSRANTTLKFDENGRPDRTDPVTAQYVIDRGNRDYYVYPSAFASEAGKDRMGGQRIYNGQIDIGPGEYDWRGDFTQALTTKPDRLAVDVATPDVTTNALGRVTLSGGDSVKLALSLPVSGSVVLTMDNIEGVTVTAGGATVEPAGGRFVFSVPEGSSTVTVAYEGDGQTAITEVVLPKRGVFLIFR